MHATLRVNGKAHVVDVDADCPLLYVLRDNLALNNPRFGCGLGQCGACTGAARVKRLVCVHDCGLIINPQALRGTNAANLMQSMSRGMKEEVTFDRSNVTSVDWRTYPVVRSSDVPDQVEIVLMNHPELSSTGAGEPSSRPTAAAINNAIFDATGARVRRGLLTPERIKAVLAALQVS